MESRETVTLGVAGVAVLALIVALVVTCNDPWRGRASRTKEKPQRILIPHEEREQTGAGASPTDSPPQTVGDIASLLQEDSQMSGAGPHLSPVGAEPNPEKDQGQPPASAGVSFTPDFAPSRERFLEMSVAIYRAQALTVGELRDIPFAFWEENPAYIYLAFGADTDTVRERLGAIEDSRTALERAWEDPTNRVLWERHQQLYRQMLVGMQGGMDTSMTQRQLDEIRDALWSSISPAHQFLYRLDQETR